jgi:hypothetical protein
MVFRRATVSLLLPALSLLAAPPSPKEHFGFTPGDDYKLAGYAQVSSYFRKLAATSDRIKIEPFGQTAEGRTMFVAFISAPENLRKLGEFKEMNRRLALGLATREEALRYAREGKAVVWIDSGLHATEVAPVQHAPHLAYKMVTDESEEVRRIRQNVILMQIPVINPDGLDMTAHWYMKNVGTAHELAPLPWLYQKYAGHDNNRDWFMMNLTETQNVARLLFHEWFPHVVYNQHQVGPFPARIFVPPYGEPLNPNIPAPVMEGINLIGSVMKERFAREDKPGTISYTGFDAWWNGGLRSAPAFHNMHGILTETALYGYATPHDYKPGEIPERFPNGMPTKEPTVFYEKPWLGGRWALMDAVNYMLTADFAILDLAARQPDYFLWKAWEMARAQIEAGQKGTPFAYVIAPEQDDPSSALELLRRLQMGGIEVRRATAAFNAHGHEYPKGTLLMPAAQPFRGYLVDLMEPQKYPELHLGQSGPTQRPYDLAGWTLSYQMGVKVDRIDEPFTAASETAEDLNQPEPLLDSRRNTGYVALARLLKQGKSVYRAADGTFLTERSASAKWEVREPRVALYVPWTGNIDTGWTQWLLDRFEVPYYEAHNGDVRKGDLRKQFDVLILAAQSMESILKGVREGERGRGRSGDASHSQQWPEYTGGIGVEGVRALEEFVEEGGTLIAFDSATELPLNMFPLGIRGLIRGSGSGEQGGAPAAAVSAGGWYCPGSLLRVTVDPSNPIGFGMPKEAIVTSTGGQAFDITLLADFNKGERETKAVVNYARQNLLASGWLSGERVAAGRAALVEARMGQGRVVLFGFRPQFRGQSYGTFKLLLNAIYLGSSTPL